MRASYPGTHRVSFPICVTSCTPPRAAARTQHGILRLPLGLGRWCTTTSAGAGASLSYRDATATVGARPALCDEARERGPGTGSPAGRRCSCC
jgi:hypothetical protein